MIPTQKYNIYVIPNSYKINIIINNINIHKKKGVIIMGPRLNDIKQFGITILW